MECNICSFEYDQNERVPKILPCGHTLCAQCLRLYNRRECPTCRAVYHVPSESLPKNFDLLRLLERPGPDRSSTPHGWCRDCEAAAAPRCWDDHEVLNSKAALRHHLPASALRRAVGQLRELQAECDIEQALLAVTLMTTEACELTVRAGGHVLTGTVAVAGDPLIKAMLLVAAARIALSDGGVQRPTRGGAQGPSEGGARPRVQGEQEVPQGTAGLALGAIHLWARWIKYFIVRLLIGIFASLVIIAFILKYEHDRRVYYGLALGAIYLWERMIKYFNVRLLIFASLVIIAFILKYEHDRRVYYTPWYERILGPLL